MNVRKIAVRKKIDSDLAEKAVGIVTIVADEVTLKRKHDEMEIILVFNAENEEVIDLTGAPILTEEDDAFRIFLEHESGKEEEEGLELIFEGDERDKGKGFEEESVQTGTGKKIDGKKRRGKKREKREIGGGKKERKREIKGRAEDESVSEADKLDKVGEVGKVSKADEVSEDGGGWLRTGNYIYRIKDGFAEARYKGHRLKLPYETVKSIFDEMPDEATVNDILDAASKLGVQLGRVKAYLLARVFTHVLFDATVTGGGERRRELKIIKPDPFSLSSEVRNKMELELEVIGKGL